MNRLSIKEIFENIVLDKEGYLSITDFGISKFMDSKTHKLEGTLGYVAPEVLARRDYSPLSDFWSLGILIYEMTQGYHPFFNENTGIMKKFIKKKRLIFPHNKTSTASKDLIGRLLLKDPKKRLGTKGGASVIKQHPWFKNLDWKLLYEKKIKPPYKPKFKSNKSLEFFDKDYTG